MKTYEFLEAHSEYLEKEREKGNKISILITKEEMFQECKIINKDGTEKVYFRTEKYKKELKE